MQSLISDCIECICRVFDCSCDEKNNFIDAYKENDGIQVASVVCDLIFQILNSYNLNRSIFSYLLQKFKKVKAEQTASICTAEICAEIQKSIFLYFGMLIENPDCFRQPVEVLAKGSRFLYLMLDSQGESALPKDFMAPFLKHWETHPDFQTTIVLPVFKGICDALGESQLSHTNPALISKHFASVEYLMSFDALRNGFFESSLFSEALKKENAPFICKFLPFASLMSICHTASGAIDPSFKVENERPVGNFHTMFDLLRPFYQNYHTQIHSLLRLLFKKNLQETTVLLWKCIESNADRAKMNADKTKLSPEGFLLNLNMVLLLFCKPIFFAADVEEPMKKIDPLYFAKFSKIIPFAATSTKMNMSESEWKNWAQKSQNLDLKFGDVSNISHFVFLCFECFRVAIIPDMDMFIKEVSQIMRLKNTEIPNLESQIQAEQPGFTRVMMEAQLKRIREAIDNFHSKKLSYDVFFRDEGFLGFSFKFFEFFIRWLLTQPLDILVAFPEHFLAVLLDFYLFMFELLNAEFEKYFSPAIPFEFFVKVLSDKRILKNPHLKAQIVEFMSYLVESKFPLGFESTSGAMKNFMPALFNFYAEVERTGSSSEFYDKFKIRYEISKVFLHLWSLFPAHAEKAVEFSIQCEAEFIQFLNYFRNDLDYLLDEAFSNLKKIREYQQEMKAPEFSNITDQQLRREKLKNLSEAERRCSGGLQLLEMSLRLFSALTSRIVRPFLRPELIDQLAATMNYYLDALAGSKRREMRVENPEKYGFRPKHLLSIFFDCYLNLAKRSFVVAIAKDSRSYSKQTFDEALGVLQKSGMKSASDCSRFLYIISAIEKSRAEDEEADIDVEDIPNDFLDPITFQLMEDPVVLPTSGISMDFSTIKRHLLNDKTDPFNRQPLALEDLRPNTELKQKIEDFKREIRSK